MAGCGGDPVKQGEAVVLVQARTGSSRLPGKALMDIGRGVTVLTSVLQRAIYSDVGPVVLATSDLARDDACASIASHLRVRFYRGSEWDVLGRMAAAVHSEPDDKIVVRITGDCPLLDPYLVHQMVDQFRTFDMADYLYNDTESSGYPDGMDVEVFTVGLLKRAAAAANDRADREHVTPWMRRMTRVSVRHCVEGDWTHLKLSVDKQEDLERVRAVVACLAPCKYALADTIAAAKKAGYV